MKKWRCVMVGILSLTMIACAGCTKSPDENGEKKVESLYYGDTAGALEKSESLVGERTMEAKISTPKIEVPNTASNVDAEGNYYKTDHNGMQGAYFDGRYLYQTFLKYCYNQAKEYAPKQVNDEKNIVVIVKYDVIAKEIVVTSEPMYLEHASDITYNSKLGYLVVAHNNKTLSYLNPTTLELVKTFDVEIGITAIDYNATTDQYAVVTSGQYGISIVSGDFSKFSEVYPNKEEARAYTKQAIACDDDYVYCLYYGTGTNKIDGTPLSTDAIIVYDWEGKFVTFIEFDLDSMEPESISVVKGDIYVGTGMSTGAYMFRIKSLEPAK